MLSARSVSGTGSSAAPPVPRFNSERADGKLTVALTRGAIFGGACVCRRTALGVRPGVAGVPTAVCGRATLAAAGVRGAVVAAAVAVLAVGRDDDTGVRTTPATPTAGLTAAGDLDRSTGPGDL